MNKSEWQKIQTIVDQALTLSGKEQQTFVEDACKGSEDLLYEVKEFLESIEESERIDFLENPGKEYFELINDLSQNISDRNDHPDLVGEKIGPYQVSELISRGGMGSVYKAERVDGQFDQTVAIKFLDHKSISSHSLSRFDAEKKILANLSHPNIALLLDGGISESGSPFLIMEYIDGKPIDEFCEKNKLSLKERLDLFSKVLSAIEFAHSNLIIHRDLKPSNIFVTDQHEVKILDFGIAKLLENENNVVDANITQQGQRLWTPQCAAPEQVRGETVTTATDVYALGVLFNKILTAKYPFDLSNKTIVEIERAIITAAPEQPSNLLSNNGESFQKIGAKDLKGDLDAIILKAIRKEQEYRYQSVSQFHEDLNRYINNLPIQARKDSFRYVFGKFFRRNKTATLGTSALLILLIIFSIFYSVNITSERNNAYAEALKAKRASQFLINLFRQGVPQEAERANLTAREILDLGSKNISDELSGQPELHAKMLTVISEAYLNIELLDKADSLVTKGLSIYQNSQQSFTPYDIAYAELVKSQVKLQKSNFEEAEVYIRNAIVNFKKSDIVSDEEVRQSILILTNILHQKGETLESEELMDEWYNIDIDDENKEEIANRLVDEGQISQMRGQYSVAEQKFRDAINLRSELYGSDHANTAIAYNRLASLLTHDHEYDSEAEALYRKALNIQESSFQEYHSEWIDTIFSLGRTLLINGEYKEAGQLFEQGMEMLDSNSEIGDMIKLTYDYRFALYLVETEQYNRAESFLSELIRKFETDFGEDYLFTLLSKEELANTLFHNGKLEEAEQLYIQILDQYESKYGVNSSQAAMAMCNYGLLLMEKNNISDAERYLTSSYKILNESSKPRRWKLALAERNLGELMSLQGRNFGAEQLLTKSFNYLMDTRGPRSNYTISSANSLISFYKKNQEFEEATEVNNLIKGS